MTMAMANGKINRRNKNDEYANNGGGEQMERMKYTNAQTYDRCAITKNGRVFNYS